MFLKFIDFSKIIFQELKNLELSLESNFQNLMDTFQKNSLYNFKELAKAVISDVSRKQFNFFHGEIFEAAFLFLITLVKNKLWNFGSSNEIPRNPRSTKTSDL